MKPQKPRRTRLLLGLTSFLLIAGIVYFLVKGAWWVSLALAIAEGFLEASSPVLFRRKPKA